jgi:hypothetical protein
LIEPERSPWPGSSRSYQHPPQPVPGRAGVVSQEDPPGERRLLLCTSQVQPQITDTLDNPKPASLPPPLAEKFGNHPTHPTTRRHP